MKPGQHLYHVQPVANYFHGLSRTESWWVFAMYLVFGRGEFSVKDAKTLIDRDIYAMRKYQLKGFLKPVGRGNRNVRMWALRDEIINKVEVTYER